MASEKPSPEERTPPGQNLTRDWPVLHYGNVPRVDLDTWQFRIFGLVEQEAALTYPEFMALPRTRVTCDIHCVTHWSRLDNEFEGVRMTDVMKLVQIRPEATHVMFHAEGGWTTNLPLSDLLRDDSLFAWRWNGQDITPEHGWPLRTVVPHLYFWKSAKWVRGMEFMNGDRPGFWEQNGYHMRGNPWAEERYWND
ncbi:MAG TPA: sulfite oxidase-like oxidoreductase [Symbiobacteriaceae bacterium]|nr:sulfite oxidase-like oxidoreductase [Symbiobacteriaceae bacterium]